MKTPSKGIPSYIKFEKVTQKYCMLRVYSKKLINGIIIFILLLNSGCFQTRHLAYNEKCDLYTYKGIPLRLPNRNTVNSKNIDTFLMQAQKYSLMQSGMSENDYWISSFDKMLVLSYDSILFFLQNGDYSQAIENIRKLCKVYPDMNYFSDINFCSGYAWAMEGQVDSAKKAFTHFLTYSGQKYPGRFRGFNSTYDSKLVFCNERLVARKYLSTDSLTDFHFSRIAPQFYFQSMSWGYVFNPEDYNLNTRIVFSGIGWTNVAEHKLFQTQFMYLLNKRLGIAAGLKTSRHIQMLSLSSPFQFAWATNRRWGIKLTPILFLAYNNQYASPIKLIPVAGFSAAYHFNSRYYAGFGLGLPINLSPEWKPFFDNERWNISINAHLIKTISASLIFQPHTIATGITFSNSILGYNWNKKLFFLSLLIF
ncbi:MAG: hypothetical protein N2662_02410 [Bacteroidales bacterium]|nr:hypothetical protein [Bacteroidales bacterium]